MHARVVYLGWEKVSHLERCPQFRSVLIESIIGGCVCGSKSMQFIPSRLSCWTEGEPCVSQSLAFV